MVWNFKKVEFWIRLFFQWLRNVSMPERNKFRSEYFLKTEIGYCLIWSCGLAKSNCPLLDEQTFKLSLCSMRFRIIIFVWAIVKRLITNHTIISTFYGLTPPPPPPKKKLNTCTRSLTINKSQEMLFFICENIRKAFWGKLCFSRQLTVKSTSFIMLKLKVFHLTSKVNSFTSFIGPTVP